MIRVFCEKCEQELRDPGALVFAPPEQNVVGASLSEKFHLCGGCWLDLRYWLEQKWVRPLR